MNVTNVQIQCLLNVLNLTYAREIPFAPKMLKTLKFVLC